MVKINITKSNRRFNTILFIGIVFSSLTIFGLVNNPNNQDIRGRAEEGPGFCEDKCIGQDRCGPNGPPGDPNYNDPCCNEIKKTGDPKACDWPQRGYCTDDQCASIPEGVSRERCGGPRHSWCNLCIDNKCPGYGSAIQPTQSPPSPTVTVYIPPTSIPTVIPSVAIPTSQPTELPTEIPPTVSYPTNYVAPTSIPPTLYISPTMTPIPTYTPTQTPKLFSLPDILPPKEKVVSFIESIKISLTSFLSKILP